MSIILKQTQCNSGIQMNGISFKAVALRTCRVILTMLPMLETFRNPFRNSSLATTRLYQSFKKIRRQDASFQELKAMNTP